MTWWISGKGLHLPPQRPPHKRILTFHQFLWPSFKDNLSSSLSAFGAEVDDVVGTSTDYAEICDMRTLNLSIPDSVNLEDREITMLIATGLYEKGKLSLGQAAELVGLSKRTFAEMLGQYGVSIFNYPPEELSRDVKNA